MAKVEREPTAEELEAMGLQADWADISTGLRKDLGAQLFSQWIKPIQLGGLCKETGTLDLFLPTEFSANWVADRFADRLSLAWKIARGDVKSVRIQVHPGRRELSELRLGEDSKRAPANDHSLDSSAIALASGQVGTLGQSTVGLDPSQTFDSFVTGDANVLACNAAQRMSATETPQFSPLYLKGATGQGKASAQEELLYTIDALLAEGKRLIFAADRAPQALDGVEPRLLSRLSMGLVADIAAADIDLRRLILEARLKKFAPLEVPGDVIEFLARTITRNIRELVGGLNKLIAYAQLTGQAVSLQLAEEQLTDILSANRRRITIDEIQRTVCQFYRVDRGEMSSRRRARAVVRPRQVAMYLSKVLTPRSYPEIGRKFGGRDHSTVIHAVRLIEDLRKRDADMDGDVRSLLRQLES